MAGFVAIFYQSNQKMLRLSLRPSGDGRGKKASHDSVPLREKRLTRVQYAQTGATWA
jgi:hypothetical protein